MQVGDTIAYVTGDTYPHRAALAEAGWVWNAASTENGFRKDGTTPKGAWIGEAIGMGIPAVLSVHHTTALPSDVAAWTMRNAPVPPSSEPSHITEDGAGVTRVDVMAWKDREVTDVLRFLRGGSIGYDPNRKTLPDGTTVTRTKQDRADDLLASFTDAEILAGYETVRGVQAPVAAAKATVEGRKVTFQETAPVAPVGAGQDDPADALARALREAIAGANANKVAPLDEARVREIAAEGDAEVLAALEKALAQAVAQAAGASRTIDVRLPDKTVVTLAGAHPAFDEVLALAVAGLNVLMVGPAGCGKTHLAEMVAQAVKARRFGTLSCTAGTTESALEGRLLPVRVGGTFCYLPSVFVDIYCNGGVFLFDEIDAADSNLLLVVNTALANGHMEIAARIAGGKDGEELDTRITRHKDCLLLAAANTYGNGATSQYTGRSSLDAATKDRFFVVPMDYDRAFERSLFAGRGADAEAFGQWVWSVRERALAGGLHHVVSSRMIAKGVAALGAGLPLATVKARSLAGWSSNDLRAVGEVA